MRMRAALLALLALALPLRATDVGTRVEFGRGPAIAAAGAAAAGEVVWESGPSDAAAEGFQALLLQGVLEGAVALEASVDGGPWTAAAGERSAEGRFWSKISLSGKRGSIVRLRAVAEGAGPASIELFGVYASDLAEERAGPGLLRHQSAPPPPVAVPGAAPKPAVAPRAEWGALPAAKPYEPMTPERISVHHTETPVQRTRDGAASELRSIQRFHQKGRGWIDIAYHFLIDGAGRVWEGRPLTLVGAHVRDRNDGNVGISLMGDFSPGRQKPTAEQLRSLIALTRWLSETYAIPAERIKGHRDQETSTACPGKALYAHMDEVRRSATAPAGLYASRIRAGAVMSEPAW